MLYLASFIAFAAVMVLMALGAVLGRRPLSGGCMPSDDCACSNAAGRDAERAAARKPAPRPPEPAS